MTECAKLRLENRLLEMKVEKLTKELESLRCENDILQGAIDDAIVVIEEMQRKRLIIEVKYGGQ